MKRICSFVKFIGAFALAGVSLFSAEIRPLSCGQIKECLRIEGNIQLEPASTMITKSRRFEAVTDGFLWQVRIFPTNVASNSQPAYWEHGTDGISVYQVDAYNTNYTGELTRIRKDGTVVTNAGHFAGMNNASATIWARRHSSPGG